MANLTDAKYLHFSFLYDVLHREKSDALILDAHALYWSSETPGISGGMELFNLVILLYALESPLN